METPIAEIASEDPIAPGVVLVITTDHWVREWFEQLLLPDLAASGKTIDFFDVSDQSLFDDHVNNLVEILKGGSERNIACFACTDCAMDVYSCAAECLAKEPNPPRGASFRCFFLATNKLACRERIAGCGGLQSRPVQMEDPMLPTLGDGIDGFFKPIAECGSKGIMKCPAGVTVANPLFEPQSDAKRRRTDETIRTRLASRYSELEPYLDEGLIGLVEEYVHPSARKISIDGFIFQGSIHHYAISENIYKAEAPEVFDSLVTPAQGLSVEEVRASWALYDKVAEDMIRRGLDNQFFDVEAFLMPQKENTTPRVEVMEVNCRTFSNQLPVFSKIFGPKRSMFAGAIDLLCGHKPSIEGDFAAKVMSGCQDYNSRYAVGVCSYMAQIPGAPVIVHDEQGNATYFAVGDFPALVYAYAQDPATARRLCDTFHADLSARFSDK